ncbi:MAG TPA: hypothetical protein VHC69_02065 [Polyangiaceae bacterium]|nr:hypothetical protein [Polyangiaceae bacterium]
MESLIERLTLVERHVTRAIETVRSDSAASPVLLAVVLEFQRKAQKAHAALSSGVDTRAAREAVVEVEQAADSANVAAAADPSASEATRKAIEVAHKAMCLIKVEGS